MSIPAFPQNGHILIKPLSGGKSPISDNADIVTEPGVISEKPLTKQKAGSKTHKEQKPAIGKTVSYPIKNPVRTGSSVSSDVIVRLPNRFSCPQAGISQMIDTAKTTTPKGLSFIERLARRSVSLVAEAMQELVEDTTSIASKAFQKSRQASGEIYNAGQRGANQLRVKALPAIMGTAYSVASTAGEITADIADEASYQGKHVLSKLLKGFGQVGWSLAKFTGDTIVEPVIKVTPKILTLWGGLKFLGTSVGQKVAYKTINTGTDLALRAATRTLRLGAGAVLANPSSIGLLATLGTSYAVTKGLVNFTTGLATGVLNDATGMFTKAGDALSKILRSKIEGNYTEEWRNDGVDWLGKTIFGAESPNAKLFSALSKGRTPDSVQKLLSDTIEQYEKQMPDLYDDYTKYALDDAYESGSLKDKRLNLLLSKGWLLQKLSDRSLSRCNDFGKNIVSHRKIRELALHLKTLRESYNLFDPVRLKAEDKKHEITTPGQLIQLTDPVKLFALKLKGLERYKNRYGNKLYELLQASKNGKKSIEHYDEGIKEIHLPKHYLPNHFTALELHRLKIRPYIQDLQTQYEQISPRLTSSQEALYKELNYYFEHICYPSVEESRNRFNNMPPSPPSNDGNNGSGFGSSGGGDYPILSDLPEA
ncbi:MAG: hypothetical protein AAGI66_09690, partial [Cyanobacteria bacterium P01_H01_bin.74]